MILDNYATHHNDQPRPLVWTIGIQYIVWTAEGEEDLQRGERVLRAHSPSVQRVAARRSQSSQMVAPGGSPDWLSRSGAYRRKARDGALDRLPRRDGDQLAVVDELHRLTVQKGVRGSRTGDFDAQRSPG